MFARTRKHRVNTMYLYKGKYIKLILKKLQNEKRNFYSNSILPLQRK